MALVGKSDWSLTFTRGNDVVLPMTYKAAGVPVDITGWTIAAQIRSKPNAFVMLDFDVTITDAAHGEFTLSASDAVTAGLRLEDAYWDIQLTSAGGLVKTLPDLGPAPVVINKRITVT